MAPPDAKGAENSSSGKPSQLLLSVTPLRHRCLPSSAATERLSSLSIVALHSHTHYWPEALRRACIEGIGEQRASQPPSRTVGDLLLTHVASGSCRYHSEGQEDYEQ